MSRHITSQRKPIHTKLQPMGDFEAEPTDDGTVIATESYRCAHSVWKTLKPRKGVDTHHDEPSLVCIKYKYKRDKKEGTFFVTFKGVASGVGGGENPMDDLPPPVWRWGTTTEELPIDTHPKFPTKIGGTPTTENGNPGPLNNAQFDEESGKFLGFAHPSKYYGRDTWKARLRTLTLAYSTRQFVDVEAQSTNVGTVQTVSTPHGMKTVFIDSLVATESAGIYSVEITYILPTRQLDLQVLQDLYGNNPYE